MAVAIALQAALSTGAFPEGTLPEEVRPEVLFMDEYNPLGD